MAMKKHGRSRCIGSRQKKYRQSIGIDPLAPFVLLHKLGGAALPIDQSSAMAQVERINWAIKSMADGNGTFEDASLLSAEMNIANAMCYLDFAGSSEHMPIIEAANVALDKAAVRSGITRRWGLDGPALLALRDLAGLREAQLLHEDNRIGIEKAAYLQAQALIDAGHVRRIYGAHEHQDAR